MNAIRRKLTKGKAGFSLAETLIAILILLMVSAIVAGAIPTASNVYTRTVDVANAQVLMSTTLTLLRDELSTATDISNDGTVITYRNSANGYCQLDIKESGAEPGIYITYLKYDPETGDTEVDTDKAPRPLVSSKAATNSEKTKMVVTYEIEEITNTAVKFKNLKVLRNETELPMASRASFTVRRVAKGTPSEGE